MLVNNYGDGPACCILGYRMFGERLARERERKGLSQQALASMLGAGYSQQLVSYYENRKGLPLEKAAPIARALGITLDYLAGLTDNPGVDDPKRPISPAPDTNAGALDVEFIPIRSRAAYAGVGDKSTVRATEGNYPFRRRRLIEEEGFDSAMSSVLLVEGSSMYPALPHGSAILLDEQPERRVLREHCIYVYETSSPAAAHVKRAKRSPEGRWYWCSDNPLDGNEPLKDTDVVWGEVRWVGHAFVNGVALGV